MLVHVAGKTSRFCAGSETLNATWQAPDFSECVSPAYKTLHQEVSHRTFNNFGVAVRKNCTIKGSVVVVACLRRSGIVGTAQRSVSRKNREGVG